MARTSTAHFEELYAASEDPWGYGHSGYERRKYVQTLAALPPAIGRCLELGSSIGAFTAMLAPRCESLIATDFSPTAVARARERTAAHPSVEVRRATLPEQMPAGPFDAIVCSEVLYYLDDRLLDIAVDRISDALADDGRLVAVHWRGGDPRRCLDGDAVHDELRSAFDASLGVLERIETPAYLLDSWGRA